MKLPRIYASWFVLTRRFRGQAEAGNSRRLRLMMGQTMLITLGVILLLGSMIGAVLYLEAQPTTLRIAVGPAAGDDSRLIQAIAAQFNRDRSTIRLHPILKENPVEAAAAIDAGQADLAVVRRDRAYPKQGLAVAVLRENVAVMIVPAAGSPAQGAAAGQRAARSSKAKKGEKIEKIEQIEGKRIGLIERNGANTGLLNLILRQYGIAPEKATIVSLDPDDVTASLRNNPVDVIFGAGPVTSKFFADAIAAAAKGNDDPRILEITASPAIARRVPVYQVTELKKGVFGGHSALPNDDINTIGYSHYIVARKTLEDSVVSDFTKLIFAVRENLAGEFPGVRYIQKPDTDKDAAVLAHPGAAAFIDDAMQTFFDRYSDFIYLGIMLFSGLGSGAAWLASYSRADDRIRKLRSLEILLDMAKAARAAETSDALDALSDEIDDILRRTMQQVERNELDAAALFAFSVVLNQARAEISERRAQLRETAAVAAAPLASAQGTQVLTQLRVAAGE